MNVSKLLLSSLLAFGCALVAPPASAACEECRGTPGNRSCRLVEAGDTGYSDCSNDFFGNCINGTSSCTGQECGTGTGGCEEEHKGTAIDRLVPAGGEVLVTPARACELAGVIIEA